MMLHWAAMILESEILALFQKFPSSSGRLNSGTRLSTGNGVTREEVRGPTRLSDHPRKAVL